MHHANADKSERLQKIIGALRLHGELSTIQLQDMARGCAVSTSISEINASLGPGTIIRRQAGRVHYYRLRTQA